MADKKEPDVESPVPKLDDKAIFALAYVAAFKRLRQLTEEEQKIAVEKAQLRESMKALGSLFNPKTADIGSLTLSNAIRLVISGAGRPISALEIRGKLKDLGYNLEQFENPMASIHTALNRMEEADELRREKDEYGKKKKFEPGPELKPVPEVPSEVPSNLGALAALCGTESEPETKHPVTLPPLRPEKKK